MGKLMDRKLSFVFIFLQLLFSIALCAMLIYVGFIPDKYVIAAIVFCTVLMIYQVCAQIANSSYMIGRVLSVCFCLIFLVGGYYLFDTYHAMAQISGADVKVDVISYYVLKDDPAQSLKDAKDYKYGILSVIDRENTDKALAEAKNEIGQDLQIVEFQDSSTLVDALYAKEIQVAVFNQGFLNTIDDQYKTFKTDTRELVQHEIETKIEDEEEEPEEDDYATSVTTKPFIVYLSGIDVYGKLSTTSRSDVNILAVVNPLTKKLLLVSTPRDYYVPLYDNKGNSKSGGVGDKLTHAGIYGVEVSMGTLERLYNVDINYFVRVNFSSVKKIINLLGGVKVYSDFAFLSTVGPYKGAHYSFKKGYNKVDGKKGLAFCRERKHFDNGDYQRGRNHQHMIEAILNKVMSPTVLGDYPALLKEGKKNFQTNMSTKKIVSLCKMQLDDMAKWKISYANAAGNGTTARTYSMPSTNLYVCKPDMQSVAKITAKINKFMNERPGDGTKGTDSTGTAPLNDQGTNQ